MDRPPHRLIAPEAEADVRNPARHPRIGQGGLDRPRRLDEVDGIVVVFLDPRRHGEDIGVEDDVLGREADLVHQDAIGAGADLDLSRGRIGLAHLVKGHDHDGRAVAQAFDRLFAELGLAGLHRDRIDDRLALDAFQARLDHLPFGAVDHQRHPGDVGLGRDQVEEGDHGLLRVEQALVHIDVDDGRAGLDLLPGDGQGGGIVAVDHQLLESGRAGDVGAFTDVDEGGSHGRAARSKALPLDGGGLGGGECTMGADWPWRHRCRLDGALRALPDGPARTPPSPTLPPSRGKGECGPTLMKVGRIRRPVQTVPARSTASPPAAPVSPASAVSKPPPPCAGYAPASCRSSRRRY